MEFRLRRRWYCLRIAGGEEPFYWHRELPDDPPTRTYVSLHSIVWERGVLIGLIVGRFYFATIKETL